MRRTGQAKHNVIETVGMINNRYEVNFYMPVDYYYQKIKKIDENLSIEKSNKESPFSIPPFCYDLYMDADMSDLSAYALSHMDKNKYELNYYVDLSNYYKEKADYDRKKRLFELGDKEIFKRKEEPFSAPKDVSSISAEGFAASDENKYDFQYYVDLAEYYREMEEYEKKLELFNKGDKEVFNRKERDISFGRDYAGLSAEALAIADKHRYDMKYYEDLSNYYMEMEEYNKKLELFNSGDINIFNRKDQIMTPLRESYELSPDALATLDSYRYDFKYYEDLSDYYRDSQEYEKKLERFNAGETDIFKQNKRCPVDCYELSAEGLSASDGAKYDMEYYKQLSQYYKDTQEYNRKLALFNEGEKDIFERKEEELPVKETSDISPNALADLDGNKYDMQYYVDLHNYYRELDEYNRKLALYNKGDKYIFERKDEEIINIRDKTEIKGKEKKEKIWTPSLEDLLAFSEGKTSPYFLDTLFYMLEQVDGEFRNRKSISNFIITMESESEVINPEEFMDFRKVVESKLLEHQILDWSE